MVEFRLLVCGGRDYGDWYRVHQTLWFVAVHYGVTEIIHGAARGADTLAERWAKSAGVKSAPYPVSRSEWERFGNSAGHLRNTRMLVEGRPNMVLAFPGGRGTANMIQQATTAGIPVFTDISVVAAIRAAL
jgi:hypothetical protein